MDQKQYLQDYEQLYCALCSHPYLIDHPEKRSEFDGLYAEIRNTICDRLSLISAATALTCWFQDGHTNIELPYQSSDLCIPIRCKWYEDRLMVSQDYQEIPKGAELTEIEGVSLYLVVKQLRHRIPHENIFLVKSRLTEYPYANYHLFSGLNLSFLFGEKQAYSLTYLYDGKNFRTALPLVPYNGFLDFCDDNFVSWQVNGTHALLKLDACICNQHYIDALAQLAQACNDQGAKDLTLDLSENMGGTSEVIEKFLEYVDMDSFHRYEMVDYFDGKPTLICDRSEAVINHKQSPLFPKNIICKIGNSTFSSARTFAVTLKDNGIATITGEPTGGRPSSYGMPLKYILQNTGIRFRVSRAWFGRPNIALDAEKTLLPDPPYYSLIG